MIKGYKRVRRFGWEFMLGLGKRNPESHGVRVSRVRSVPDEYGVDGVCVGFRRSFVTLYRMPQKQVASR